MDLDRLREDIAIRGKRGFHFIFASIIIWSAVLVVWLLPIKGVSTKNLLTFCITATLLPIAFMISKLIKAEFSTKDNSLNGLGILFSCNQFLYILIAMWIYQAAPEKMVMILAIIFGAHLLPFGWLYKSKAYFVMAIVVSLTSLIVGIIFSPVIVSIVMIFLEIIFSIWLSFEIKVLGKRIYITENEGMHRGG
ncbi:hypothetical protein M3215_06150 [Bacillus cytotoxicus]|uniref:Uncharacterized protein n=1 Tax=Bacillus cytotoxicus TaxID=580165 RepID=A0ACC6A481_9BACI|nr:hypothetical protein [Bacillus cytotoxicus]HDX9578477.1 hypothetical protein [Bacillus pseudomycoides]